MTLLIKCGTYTGNGSDPQVITGVGFRPKWLVVGGGAATSTLHKSTATGDSTDDTQYFNGTVNATNRIQSLDSDGFTVGGATNINAVGETYHYMALTGDNIYSGSYTGDGVDNLSVKGLPFIPQGLWIKRINNAQSICKTKEGGLGDLASRMLTNQAPTTNLIQAFRFREFEVGTNSVVNTAGAVAYYIAFGRTGGDGGFI